MWSYLEHVSLLLEGVARILQDLSPGLAFEARQPLTIQSIGLKHGSTAKIITAAHSLPFVTDEKGEITPGVLLYIMEGVLPMLKVQEYR